MTCGIFPEMGNNLRKLREAREWDEQDAANEFGMSLSGYRKIERGERRLNDAKIDLATRIYGVPASTVLGKTAPDVAELFVPRLELIRRAYRADLPDILAISAGDWNLHSRSTVSVLPNIADKIRSVTGLDYDFIRSGLLENLADDDLRRLLGAALASTPGNDSANPPPPSKPVARPARSTARLKKPAPRSAE